MTSIEDEIQELRELVAQLEADNDRLCHVSNLALVLFLLPQQLNLAHPSQLRLINTYQNGLFLYPAIEGLQNLLANPV